MAKQTIIRTMNRNYRIHNEEHGHQYAVRDLYTKEIMLCEKLPPLLKAIREETYHRFKVPHGNKVRTIVLEQGMCTIEDQGVMYEIYVERW